MSEQSWIDFLRAEGVDDWVVLHGGATAVFRVGSLEEAASLAGAIAQVPDLDRSGVLMTVASDRLTVRLTRGVFRLEPHHVDLARAVSEVARNCGAVSDRGAVQEVQLAIAAKPDAVDVHFWRAVLGYSPLGDDNAIDPLGHGSTVWMQELDPNKALVTPCTSTSPSRATAPRRGLPPPSPLAAVSSTNPTRRKAGSSLTAPGTRSASLPGPTAPSGATRLEPEVDNQVPVGDRPSFALLPIADAMRSKGRCVTRPPAAGTRRLAPVRASVLRTSHGRSLTLRRPGSSASPSARARRRAGAGS
jgi:4a-hydroxytetrahydrobiopterin dehydratase